MYKRLMEDPERVLDREQASKRKGEQVRVVSEM
jgi:hypothetical protein